MTRSLLIVHSGYPEATNFFMPDSGLASLAACLLEAGHHTEILDFNTPATLQRLVRPGRPQNVAELIRDRCFAELRAMLAGDEDHQRQVFLQTAEEVANKVQVERIDWVGFKLWSGDSLLASHAMAARIKETCPGVKTIAGGPQVDRLQDLILSEFPAFDVASIREGEPCIVPFAEHVAGKCELDQVPNLLIRRGDAVVYTPSARVEDLDALPLPCYDEAIYPAMAGGKLKVLCFEESRGCKNRCTFCTHRSKAGHLRVKEPGRVVSDLQDLMARTGAPAFRLSGSYTPSAILQQIADHFLEQESPPLWTSFGHVGDSEEVDFARVHAAGCVSMLFGIESGSQRILDQVIHKGITLAQIKQTLPAAQKSGIKVIASLIYPNHTETARSRQETLTLMDEIQPFGVSVLFPGLFPGSRWWADPGRYGFQVEDLEAFRQSLLSFKIRLFLPIALWDMLSFKLDGKDADQVVAECLDFTKALRDLGIQTSVPEEVVLFSCFMDKDPNVLKDLIVQSFIQGDADYLEQMVNDINGSSTTKRAEGKPESEG